jgi:hypothetical protein
MGFHFYFTISKIKRLHISTFSNKERYQKLILLTNLNNLVSRLEREKQELRDYMEKDKKAMKEKLSKEEEERQRQEEEMKKKLRQQQEQSENEIINLYKVKLDENKKNKIKFDLLKETNIAGMNQTI